MPQKALGKSKKVVEKAGRRHKPAERVTKKGAATKTPKKGLRLQQHKQSKEISKVINKRNEDRAAASAKKAIASHILKLKDLKGEEEAGRE